MDLKNRLTLYLAFSLSIALAVIVEQSLASPIELIKKPFHVSWTDRETKFDFIFSYRAPLDELPESFKPSSNSSLACTGHAACLLRNETFVQPYYLDKKDGQVYEFKTNTTTTSNQTGCSNDKISIYNYCSTHWNSPVHLIGDGNCSHTFEWNSPYLCDYQVAANYEHPCYTFDSGKLFDLTDWVLSNGSSYKVDTGAYSGTIKQFNLNVCNEAHHDCGPNVSSCYTNDEGLVESGFNNLTSLKYDQREEALLLTYLGQYKEQCPDKRIKTVVRFICNNRVIKHTKPKLIKSSPCENIIVWKTIHACPVSDTKVEASKCAIKYAPLGLDIDLRNLTNNATKIEVKNITLGGKQKTMLLSLCQGIRSLKCEGKDTSRTTACLIDAEASSSSSSLLTANNSQIVGIQHKSSIKLAGDRLYLESYVPNKQCQFSSGYDYAITKNVGTRIEFFCSRQSADMPTFLGYQECVYVFEWGSELMCGESADGLDNIETYITTSTTMATPTKTQTIAPLTPTPANISVKVLTDSSSSTTKPKQLSDKDLKIDIDNQRVKSAQEMHNETIKEAIKIIAETGKKDKATINNKSVEPVQATVPPTPVEVSSNQTSNKMNGWHKFFMISLILISLTGFIVAILILDRKTQFKLPIGNIRRRAAEAFQPQPVPYTRVNDFNDSLDL